MFIRGFADGNVTPVVPVASLYVTLLPWRHGGATSQTSNLVAMETGQVGLSVEDGATRPTSLGNFLVF